MLKIFSLFFSLFFFTQCSLGPSSNTSFRTSHQKPLDYYAKFKAASFGGNPSSEPDELKPDTRGDKARNIVLGTLAGLAFIAGIVVPIVVLKK